MNCENKQSTIMANIAQKRSNQEESSESITDFGIMNAWSGKTPELVTKCRSNKHTLSSKLLGRCYFEYTCIACGYKYSVDSSD